MVYLKNTRTGWEIKLNDKQFKHKFSQQLSDALGRFEMNSQITMPPSDNDFVLDTFREYRDVLFFKRFRHHWNKYSEGWDSPDGNIPVWMCIDYVMEDDRHE